MRIKTGLIVSSFPSEDSPSRGVFNQRAAEQLSQYADITVIHLRMWKPGRKVVRKYRNDKYTHIILSAPYLPVFEEALLGTSIAMYEKAGMLKLRKELSEVDIFHSVGASVAGFIGSKWAKRYKKHNVLQVIGTDINTELPRLTKKGFFRELREWTHGVGCNSMALKEAYEKLMGNTKHIEVIYRGIDTNKFKPSYSKNLGVVFLFLGGVPFYKSIMNTRNLKGGVTLMDTWSMNEEFFYENNAKLIFAGPDSDSGYVNDWKTSLKYPQSFINAGALKPEEVQKRISEADVVLIPSLEEGMPNVLMEAAASGKCVIATNIGGIPELIKDNETGLLVKQGDADTLGAAMKKVITIPEIIHRLGNNARKAVEQNFDSSGFGRKYFELYKAALGEPL